MITLNPYEAESIMNAQFLARFAVAATATLIGYQPVILWAGNELKSKPDTTKYFVRVSHQSVLSKQANLSNCEGIAGQKRFRVDGLTFVQIFCPTTDKEVERKGLQLATIARNAFRGSDDGAVWFYNVRINKLGIENDLHRLNVIAEHEYDELG